MCQQITSSNCAGGNATIVTFQQRAFSIISIYKFCGKLYEGFTSSGPNQASQSF